MFQRHFLSCFLALVMLFGLSGVSYAQDCECICDTKTKTEDIGLARFTLPPFAITDCLSTAFLLEYGSKEFRVNGTLGWKATYQDFFKVSGEWLTQRNEFLFCTGSHEARVKQDAVGIAYEHVFCHPYILGVEVGGSYSHAMGKRLHSAQCSSLTTVHRHIAGSEAWDARIGGNFNTFCDGIFSLFGTYDCVKYQNRFHDDEYVKGFGGGAMLSQRLFCDVDLVATVELRRPYYFYEAQLNWVQNIFSHNVSIGVFTSYTHGQKKLGNNSIFGVNIGFDLNCKEEIYSRCCEDPPRNWSLGFNQWVAIPAVYKPKVLARPEQEIIVATPAPACIPPAGISPAVLMELWFIGVPITPYDASTLFTGSSLTYSISGGPSGITINSTTGVISGTPIAAPGDAFEITITATNSCGAANVVLPVLLDPT